MQIQKKEIRDEILKVATKEFLKKGFNVSSMRIIAKKSNTTLGNLYNYFESKESILDAVVDDLPCKMDAMLEAHRKRTLGRRDVIETLGIEEATKQVVKEVLLDELYYEELLNYPFIILMEGCKDTKYEAYKDQFLNMITDHAREHLDEMMPHHNNEFLAKAMGQSFLSVLLFIGKNKKSVEEGKSELMRYVMSLVAGIGGKSFIKDEEIRGK